MNKKIVCKTHITDPASVDIIQSANAINYMDNKELLDMAEAVDKIDIFDHMLTSSESYMRKTYKSSSGKSVDVGIEKDPDIHSGNKAILKHQIKAVETFLGSFRGIGVLADEVGLGKTVEAGVIISELAERNLASSLLVVAASENNIKDWQQTLGDMFGLTDIVRVEKGIDIKVRCDEGRPNVPMVMLFDDFCNLRSNELRNVYKNGAFNSRWIDEDEKRT